MSIFVELPEDQYNPKAFANFASGAGFDLGTALAMAWISQLAYETRLPDKIEHVATTKWHFDDVHILKRPTKSTLPLSSTHGVIATRNDATIIAFAGTDPLNLLNWISDFYLGRPGPDVHQGFEDAADAVWEDVEAAIEQCMNDGRALFIAGHSLGAAIALVTADRARQEKGLQHGEVYVFGSPRVGRAISSVATTPVLVAQPTAWCMGEISSRPCRLRNSAFIMSGASCNARVV
jgi:triacylglycerol lipase